MKPDLYTNSSFLIAGDMKLTFFFVEAFLCVPVLFCIRQRRESVRLCEELYS
jgi:hypothetical protein